jgi:hypothetical protein
LDVEREFGAAIGALRDLAAENRMELQVVLQPGLKIWSDPYALRQRLVEVMTHAIGRAPGGGVLLCAHWHGGRVHTTITDDGAPGDPMRLRVSLRRIEECVALPGGTLEATCRAVRGNVLTLRLPGVGEPVPPVSDDMPMEEPQMPEIPLGAWCVARPEGRARRTPAAGNLGSYAGSGWMRASISAPSSACAIERSYAFCSPSQNCGLVRNRRANRSAMSEVRDPGWRSSMMAVMRLGVTSSAAANSLALSCMGSMNSSRNTLPGCIRALRRAMIDTSVGSGGSSSAAPQHGGDSWQQKGRSWPEV